MLPTARSRTRSASGSTTARSISSPHDRAIDRARQALPQTGHHLHPSGRHDPPHAGLQTDHGRRGTGLLSEPGRRCEGKLRPRVVEEVDHGERDVLAGAVEHAARRAARVPHGSQLGRRDAAQLLQDPQPALGQHLGGGLQHGDEDAADAVPDPDRAVGEGPVGLLDVAVPAVGQEQVPRVRRALAGEHAPGERPHLGPRLRVAVRGVLADRPRVLLPDEGHEGVVVELGHPRAPPDDHRHPRRHHRPDRRAQLGRPTGDGAQRRRRPVDRPVRGVGGPGVLEQDLAGVVRHECTCHRSAGPRCRSARKSLGEYVYRV